MDFNWKSPIIPRIALLTGSMLLFFIFAFTEQSFVPAIIFFGVTAYQVKLLVDYVDRSNNNIADFLDAIEFDDFSLSFKTASDDPAVKRLHRKLNEALERLRNVRRERDSEYLFFRNIVNHVGIGLIAFRENGTVEIFNTAARKLLKVNRTENISELENVSAQLLDTCRKLKTGGRELLRMKVQEDLVQLSIYAIELTLRGENVKLISLQNIQSELEEKEMEAWQNLVRVLTHEIMNSVTPISSLAGTVEDDLQRCLARDSHGLKPEEIEDIHLSLQTISKRSEGLIRFVKEFRSLTSIPKPRPAVVPVQKLIEEVTTLHKMELMDKGIAVELSVYPEDLTILADKSLIEQVLINLLKNAVQSFEDNPYPAITIRGYVSDKSRPIISVKDNGSGIDAEAMEKIFIPFFTTKKSGSGIGLSLSRQIMRQHQGSLTVKSTLGEGTEFFLRF